MDRGRAVHLERRRQGPPPGRDRAGSSSCADPRLRRETGRLAVVAQGAQEPPQLRHRFPAGRLDGEQRGLRLVGRRAEDLACRAGLDDHDADRVRDDVVQLARDVPALFGRRRRACAPPVRGWTVRRPRRDARLDPPTPEDVAQQPGRKEDDERQDSPSMGLASCAMRPTAIRQRPRDDGERERVLSAAARRT